MQQKIISLLSTIIFILLLYLGNPILLEVGIFIYILLSALNKNTFAYLSIIPLIFINQNIFLIYLVMVILFWWTSLKIKNKKIYHSILLIVSMLYFIYVIYINKFGSEFIISLVLTTYPVIIFNTFVNKQITYVINEVILLSISILTIVYIPVYLFVILYAAIVVLTALNCNKKYYLITSFFVVIYALYMTNNYAYILIQIMAYLGFLLNTKVVNKNEVTGLEFLLEDINLSVSKFCGFITTFSDNNYDKKHEENLSYSIKILIENYCVKCKNRNLCYGDKKLNTYIFLKDILSKPSQTNSKDFFNCIYYSDIKDSALYLQKQYNLSDINSITDYKLQGVCYSIQNYFISLFEKVTPTVLKILNFQKLLQEKNIKYIKCDHSILGDDKFQLKIYSSKNFLSVISDEATHYFAKMNTSIIVKDDHVIICPKKNFKVYYDSASLSQNNCQISGDNFLFKNVNDMNFICALSDGMGSGFNAYQLSQQTLKMVDKITDCSIDFETSLEILNNFFKTKDSQESYATLDFVDINLNTGILNLYKMGASTTFVSRDGKIIPIYNNNLPFGISDLIIKEQYTLVDNDLIILVSDGVTDYIKENILIKYIESLQFESPHKIVYEILQKIYYDNGNKINDDMSCVALKIKKIN